MKHTLMKEAVQSCQACKHRTPNGRQSTDYRDYFTLQRKKKTTSLITTLKGRRADLSSHNGEITGRTSTRPPSLQAAGTPLSPLPFLGHCKYNSLRFLGSLHCYQHRGLWAGKPSHLLDILLCTYTHTFLDQETYIQQRGSMEKKCRDPELKMKGREV